MVYSRGDILDLGNARAVVLGGPTKYGFTEYYTIRWLEDVCSYSTGEVIRAQGSTQAWPYDGPPAGHMSVPSNRANVIYGHCGECDEDEMIFYEGDYICAWCREHFEDAVW